MKQSAIFMVLSDKVANNSFTVLDKFEIADFKTKVFNQILIGLETKLFAPVNSVSAAPETADNLKGKAGVKTEKTKTKNPAKKRSFLIITEASDKKLSYSAGNLPGVELININNINIVDLLRFRNLIMTKAAVEKVEERYKK